MAANPNYDSAGEIPVTVRGAGIDTVDGFRERAPMDFQVDFHTDYTVRAYSRRFVVSADMFNLFNRREPDNYDYCSDSGFNAPNANFGYPISGCTLSFPSFQAPFAIRLGVRFEF